MFNAIARLFGHNPKAPDESLTPRLAVAALLVHLAAVDGESSSIETATIATALKSHYGLDDSTVKTLIAQGRRKDREAVDFYQFTTRLNRLDEPEKRAIIAMMWQVVFADGANHELEDNMIWRVAELIGVSARERTLLRNAARRAAQGPDAAPDAGDAPDAGEPVPR